MQPLENISISSSEVEAIPEKHALKYVTNYLCRKYLQHHQCKSCELQLGEQTNEHFDSFMKAKLPTNAICSALECCENLFLQSFTKRMHLKFIHSSMLKLMLEKCAVLV